MTAHGNPVFDVDAFIKAQPVGRLATADANGHPHVVPICYVYDGRCLYTPLDLKPKSVPVLRLKRVRNIAENPKISVVVDHYSDDWSQLGYTLIRGSASVLEEGDERARAEAMLREKSFSTRNCWRVAAPLCASLWCKRRAGATYNREFAPARGYK